MPTFLGLAVSIHADSNPLPEYSIQKQSKYHRITSYIPVPPAKIPPGATKPEQSSFAISITLLTPGLHVPYSTPKPTPEEPNPKPKIVGGLPGQTGERGKYSPTIAPYKPLTTSPNETIAAYIYFDGRAKEEVATLLRRGEETWVNSRWVSVPESEGGGLAEREFLFREVGLERWLNGLDLEGKDKDVAAKIERRKQRLEKKRAKRREAMNSSDEEDKKPSTNGVLRYSESQDAPVETLSGNDEFFTTDSDSEDEPPMPEAAGQIKVALFRVLASGEIKRGEYSPQFDAHDDDEQNGGEGDDVDHTTSFAKPKTLDPKSISTQTVTGIDPPDKPYAVFTFLYRGERQLRKMGILTSKEPAKVTSPAAKRKSGTLDFGSLKPLNADAGTKNFGGYRETSPKSKKKNQDAMDSDVDDEDDVKVEDMDDDKDFIDKGLLSPEDALKQGELAEGVRKIKLKRQHSAEPVGRPAGASISDASGSPLSGTPAPDASSSNNASTSTPTNSSENNSSNPLASPFKKQRASLPGFDESVRKSLGQALMGAQKERGNSDGNIPTIESKMEEDEEL
ncbi:hypothetical protein COCC4DRAFT_54233 [Bipolaris maydis ATCC 48331]|uniref:DUF7918 domain-containing protein n=1 Tax=Cochliobolus heterostrophus (strain C4 / ATCC 48331 / race T) TaxID=665024 RepID=N4X3H2_COCH4|nr:uncharacterized protein COCC4DRAFT_54233 [Bipolaris maydis ATCC 48331]KAH7552816.1 hypothetical protein BM1_08767 [Bipolaris maydis]ENH99751.1 hypothetical protein COCC4DRAFT_54233 [Bipolaris maydis ATCC 48331]KAJ5025112.1 hypothetical protein J3E73DRAFT_235813 [Bipolaris maydis]KAJ5057343.1 hypothetical protein J3E74DRAFT_278623 [Bipolaris maydis]KAJ6194128.1 hypothetical protein J3E72DRAFT_387934 [Bipolaris maydis]